MSKSEDKNILSYKKYPSLASPEELKKTKQKVVLDRNEVIDLITIMEGFKRKLQAKLKQA
jgi:hypothetical protein